MPDEARDWEAVRAAAIRAVRDVASAAAREGRRCTPAVLADAVLAVCDEEAVNRMADHFVNETRIRGMDFRNGADMDLVPSQTLVASWVAAARTFLGEAPNYNETEILPDAKAEMEVKLAGELERYVFILQRVGPGRLTPHEARKQAEAEAERLRAKNAELRRQLETAMDREALRDG